ncbi:hypothetical protein [Adhaeribacter pallidiroseus]|uniref:Uncharacterized protein n=1 Tax=Adhaeribacter pallidiroseus TaxID=2072847 RepID=A0A369QP69_9BACT|nr:hypothetical protein [Adhaeribacter pallidiroseus]RDC65076.1 hypothetical protein AHMF7616_03699 [Adhaeribacter pallidiroseus]
MKDNKLLLIAGAAGAFLIYQNQQKKKQAEAAAQRAYILAQTGSRGTTPGQPNVVDKVTSGATTIIDTISKGKELFSSIFKKPTLPPVSNPAPSWKTEGKVDYSGLSGITNKLV